MIFKIQYGQIYSVNEKSLFDKISDLKSNMDRFIVKQFIAISNNILNLKSNMDRFIAKR